MHKLTIEDDEGKTVVVPLIREEINVGRQEGNSIRLTERNISRRHARFFRQSGTLHVEDLGSYNGVKVNGARIAKATGLKDGDLVIIGDYKLVVRTDRPTATMHYAGGTPFAPVASAPSPAAPASPAAPPAPQAAAPAPEVALDGAPTIPVRTLAEQGLVPAQTPGAPPSAPAASRLVITSTNLAGGEFALDRASLVIGRTPENDVVLNHKSISRHHAKIIRDGERYVVVDLESANGVRVNGVEFERVELQSGDLLELGHVRLRFVGANEPFDFEPGARGPSKRKLIIGGAIGAVALGGLVLAMGGGGEKPKPTPVATAPAAPATPPLAAAPPAPAPPPAAPASPEPFLADAKAAIAKEEWAAAEKAVSRALEVAPSSAEAGALKQTIAAEEQNAERFANLKQDFDGKNYEAVLEVFTTITEGSLYRGRAQPLQAEARTRAIAQHLGEAKRRQTSGQCDDARKEADAVLSLDAANAGAKAVIDRCERQAAKLAAKKEEAVVAVAERPTRPAAAVVAPARVPSPTPSAVAPRAVPAHATIPAPVRPSAPAERPHPPERPRPEAPAPTGDPDSLIQEAQQAWLRGQYAAAIESSRKALRLKPSLTRAYQIIAVCSCSLRDADSATKAYEKLDEKIKPLVKSACQKSGIVLD